MLLTANTPATVYSSKGGDLALSAPTCRQRIVRHGGRPDPANDRSPYSCATAPGDKPPAAGCVQEQGGQTGSSMLTNPGLSWNPLGLHARPVQRRRRMLGLRGRWNELHSLPLSIAFEVPPGSYSLLSSSLRLPSPQPPTARGARAFCCRVASCYLLVSLACCTSVGHSLRPTPPRATCWRPTAADAGCSCRPGTWLLAARGTRTTCTARGENRGVDDA